MKTQILILCTIAALTLMAVSSCDNGPGSPKGFSLPEGNVESGKVAILKYHCLSCHELEGLQDDEELNNPKYNISLGGKKRRVKTYADLLTSIINPSHKLAPTYLPNVVSTNGISDMTNYNDVMTVTELVDVVSFLQDQYEVKPYEPPNYQYYGY